MRELGSKLGPGGRFGKRGRRVGGRGGGHRAKVLDLRRWGRNEVGLALGSDGLGCALGQGREGGGLKDWGFRGMIWMVGVLDLEVLETIMGGGLGVV